MIEFAQDFDLSDGLFFSLEIEKFVAIVLLDCYSLTGVTIRAVHDDSVCSLPYGLALDIVINRLRASR